MSIDVPIAQLSQELDRRPYGFLITVGDDSRSHVLALRPQIAAVEGDLVIWFATESRRAASNAGVRPEVTIVFPTGDEGGMSLIVDGTATATPNRIDVRPSRATLHRAAPRIDLPPA